jgi:hypothetical protein
MRHGRLFTVYGTTGLRDDYSGRSGSFFLYFPYATPNSLKALVGKAVVGILMTSTTHRCLSLNDRRATYETRRLGPCLRKCLALIIKKETRALSDVTPGLLQ